MSEDIDDEKMYQVQFRIKGTVLREAMAVIKDMRLRHHYAEKWFEEGLLRNQRRKGRALSQDEETIRRIVREEMGK